MAVGEDVAGCLLAPGALSTYVFSSCFFQKLKIMHFQNPDIQLYTVGLMFLYFLKFV